MAASKCLERKEEVRSPRVFSMMERMTSAVRRRPPEIAAAYGVAPELTRVPDGMTDWDQWRDTHAPLTDAPIGAAPMFYTSGTTGLPKGVRRKPKIGRAHV